MNRNQVGTRVGVIESGSFLGHVSLEVRREPFEGVDDGEASRQRPNERQMAQIPQFGGGVAEDDDEVLFQRRNAHQLHRRFFTAILIISRRYSSR